ncbi:hypothetical protein C8R46DRAFT_371488 [Mycena filopes]|nr:hypothetical protein C8R46DRAFT_371488 [Mycena filopes]
MIRLSRFLASYPLAIWAPPLVPGPQLPWPPRNTYPSQCKLILCCPLSLLLASDSVICFPLGLRLGLDFLPGAAQAAGALVRLLTHTYAYP